MRCAIIQWQRCISLRSTTQNGAFRSARRGGSIQPGSFQSSLAAVFERADAVHRRDGGLRHQPFLGRFAQSCGHTVRLIPPIYVKPFVKRQKNDAGDAAAIAEAAERPNIHYVEVKSAEHPAREVAFRTHRCFARQRTQLINALRGHLGEFEIVIAQGPANFGTVVGILTDRENNLPEGVREIGQLYLNQIRLLTEKSPCLIGKLQESTKANEDMRRLCTVPGVGPVTAGAILAFSPDLDTFKGGQNFGAWLGLVPRRHSTGGKTRLGGVSKMGQTDIRKLLIIGAMSLIRWIVRKGASPDSWLGRLLGRKPRMVAAVALVNKMARIIWAMMTKEENYRMA